MRVYLDPKRRTKLEIGPPYHRYITFRPVEIKSKDIFVSALAEVTVIGSLFTPQTNNDGDGVFLINARNEIIWFCVCHI
jgi:hypothetical protein